jgi:hypothetical protein
MHIDFRYTSRNLLAAVVIAVLCVGVLQAGLANSSSRVIALAGLNLCTLGFAWFCHLWEFSFAQTAFYVAVLYVWGRLGLYMTDGFEPLLPTRMLLAVLGAAYVLWVLCVQSRPVTE